MQEKSANRCLNDGWPDELKGWESVMGLTFVYEEKLASHRGGGYDERSGDVHLIDIN